MTDLAKYKVRYVVDILAANISAGDSDQVVTDYYNAADKSRHIPQHLEGIQEQPRVSHVTDSRDQRSHHPAGYFFVNQQIVQRPALSQTGGKPGVNGLKAPLLLFLLPIYLNPAPLFHEFQADRSQADPAKYGPMQPGILAASNVLRPGNGLVGE